MKPNPSIIIPATIMLIFSLIITSLIIPFSEGMGEDRYIYFRFQDNSPGYQVMVIGNTLFYTESLFQGILPEKEDYTLTFLDGAGAVISTGKVYLKENNYYPLDYQISKIRLEKGTAIISEQSISFCNDNSVCEPCTAPGCPSAESSLSCSDCPSGGSDLSCDLENDGICDPDCEGKDADCHGCADECWYSDSTMPTISCSADKNGIGCRPGQLCTGQYIYADDTGSLCCTGGICKDKTSIVIPNSENASTLPEEPEQIPEDETTKTRNNGLWLIPLVAVLALGLLAYFMFRKPRQER